MQEVAQPTGTEPAEEDVAAPENTTVAPPPPDDPYMAYDGRVGFMVTGSDGDSFQLAEGQYKTLDLFLDDDTTWSGDIRFWVTAPSGSEYEMVDGMGVYIDGGVANVAGSVTNSMEAVFEVGTWTVAVEGSGNADLHLIVDVE